MSKSTQEYLLPFIAAAVDEWQKKNPPEVIKQRVFDRLDGMQEEIAMKLLGFNQSWGKWEVDHCNGRSGNSAAGDYLRNVQREAVQEWLKQLKFPTMSATHKKQIESSISDEYKNRMSSAMRRKAEEQANEDLNRVFAELSETSLINKYLSTIELLNPKGKK